MTIQATWHDHALLLWSPPGLPAAASDAPTLRDLIGQFTPDALLVSAAVEDVVKMWLPTQPVNALNDQPPTSNFQPPTPNFQLPTSDSRFPTSNSQLPTSNLQPPTPNLQPPTYNFQLQVFDIPILRFSPPEAMDLLLSLPNSSLERSDSLKYWRILARFARDAIIGQRFFPTARRVNAHHEASWRLSISGAEEIERLEKFAAAMPPSCRAIIPQDLPAAVPIQNPNAADAASIANRKSQIANISPLALVDSFLADTSDALIRRAASADPFFTRVIGLSRQPGAGPEVRLLAALLSHDRLLDGEARENDVLVDQVRLWTSRLGGAVGGAAGAGGWQLGFELCEPSAPPDAPADDPSPWYLGLRLAPLGEGNAIDAEELWSEVSPLSALGRQLPELRAVMRAELLRAMEVFPPLRRLADESAPSGIHLSAIEAQQFLRQTSAELQAQSFAVTLPEWAKQPDRRLSLVMALRPMDDAASDSPDGAGGSAARRGDPSGAFGPSRMGLDSLLEFDWRISLGGEGGMELSPDEFESLVRRQSPLVRVRGRWVEIDADAAAAALELMERQKAGQTTLGDAFRAAFTSAAGSANGSGGSKGSAPSIVLSGTAWVRDLLDQLPKIEAEQVAQPDQFHGTLRPYQLRGLQWLAFLERLGIGGCLADDMGLGKTIQLIALLLHERKNGDGGCLITSKPPKPRNPEDPTKNKNGDGGRLVNIKHAGPTLLFAPTSVVGNWTREIQRFAPDVKVLLHHGPQRHRGQAFAKSAMEVDIVITSYALAHRDRDDFARVKWHRLALDEAQKIKNPSAASSVAIRSLSAPRRVALTGTPIENHLSELWSIMDVLNPGLLGSARDFREKFAVPIEKLLDRDRGEHLRKMIRPFVLRRTKNDPEIAGDLPDKIEMKVFCNLTVEQAAMYERATSEMLSQIDAASGIRRRGLILAVLTRLKQICDHPVLVGDELKTEASLDQRSGKAERLVEMLEEVTEENDSALVFTQYAQMGHLLHRLLSDRLPKVQLFYLHGGTPQKQRDEMVRQFQESPSPSVFILSLRAGGLGLNLTAASHVFHYDRWWNPAIENQATDRAHRIGQTRTVQVHKFIAVGTVEERIDRLLSEKTHLAESIVGAGDEWLTDLSTNDLREYLKLNDEAVGEF